MSSIYRPDKTIISVNLYFLHKRKSQLLFMRGLPRSGKSTVAKEYEQILSRYTDKKIVIVDGDDFRWGLHGQTYNRLAEPAVSQSVLTAIRALLRRYFVIFDETNSSRWSLNRIFEIDRFASYSTILTPINICLERNKRSGKGIPNEVFERVDRQLKAVDVRKIRMLYLTGDDLCI